MATTNEYRDVGEAAWAWVLGHLRDDDGPWLPVSATEGWEEEGPADDRDSLYAGIAGLAPVLAEIALARPWNAVERALASDIVGRLSAMAGGRAEPSLYDGLAGDATALRILAPGSEQGALTRLAELMTLDGWRTTLGSGESLDACLSDIIGGTAGIVMTAIWAGGEHAASIALGGCEALLRAAEPTEAGLNWSTWPGARSSGPNYSHGTAGISSALAVTGRTLDRPDLVEAAVAGARHLLAVGSLENGGFVVPHTIPPSTRDVEPITYTWCHGPAGTSHLFAALAYAGVQHVDGYDVPELRQRCFRSILSSGVPQRLRPGFWDNDGRCCGTAGVGDVLLDAAQDAADTATAQHLLVGAITMGDALLERAIHADGGVHWRFVEHRQDPPLLPPGTSWMQGAAGIATFLLRLARVQEEGLDAPVVDRPDQWWAVPDRLPTAHVGAP
jgi:Lanthionine synthetase C-like protein